MPTIIDEEYLRFEFGDDWHVVKYDDHPDYRNGISHLQETKAVDFAAIYAQKVVFFIEVKDFRGHRIENRNRISQGELAIEVAQKVRDTIAGIVAAHRRGGETDWRTLMSLLPDPEGQVKVVLWLEDDVPPGPRGRAKNRASVLIDDLKRHLRWLTTKVFVESIALGGPVGLTATSLPGADRRA